MSDHYTTKTDDLTATTDEKFESKIYNSRPKTAKRHRRTNRRMSSAARATTFLKKTKIKGLSKYIYSTIPNTKLSGEKESKLEKFKEAYFNKNTPEFSRLGNNHDPILKLLVCQYVLTANLSVPIVIRLPTRLHTSDGKKLKLIYKQIQKRLKAELGREPQFWAYGEFDKKESKLITHINFEIQLDNYEETTKIYKALSSLYKKLDGNPSSLKAVSIPLQKRQKLIKQYGEFYTHFNWVSYSSKQISERQIERVVLKKQTDERYHYITKSLNKQAADFYNNNIKK